MSLALRDLDGNELEFRLSNCSCHRGVMLPGGSYVSHEQFSMLVQWWIRDAPEDECRLVFEALTVRPELFDLIGAQSPRR